MKRRQCFRPGKHTFAVRPAWSAAWKAGTDRALLDQLIQFGTAGADALIMAGRQKRARRRAPRTMSESLAQQRARAVVSGVSTRTSW